jgi:hypothetical protein
MREEYKEMCGKFPSLRNLHSGWKGLNKKKTDSTGQKKKKGNA